MFKPSPLTSIVLMSERVTSSSSRVRLEMVSVSVVAFVVSVTPPAWAKVRVSVEESATMVDCPETAMFVKESEAVPPPLEAMVMESVVASVVRVMFDPATRVRVSVFESAATVARHGTSRS